MKVINIIISNKKNNPSRKQNKQKQQQQKSNNKKTTQSKTKTLTQIYFKCLGAKSIKIVKSFQRSGNVLYLSFLQLCESVANMDSKLWFCTTESLQQVCSLSSTRLVCSSASELRLTSFLRLSESKNAKSV